MNRHLEQHNARVRHEIFVADIEAWIARELGEDEGELRW